MSLPPAKSNPSVSDASITTSRGHNALYWVVSGGLLLTGVGATAMSLLLPSDDDSLLLSRIIATSAGVLLTALSSAVITYLLTRIVTVADVEKRYTGVLDRIARSLAHVYANLQSATSQRRSGAYEHEETYQEVILAGASSLLAEFDSVTRLSGSISGAFQESKKDLDEVLGIFVVDPVVAKTMTAARYESQAASDVPVTLACPSCNSRVAGQLAMRAGWTSTLTCQNCRSTFNIHRRGDLTVYASPPRTSSPQPSTPELKPDASAADVHEDNNSSVATSEETPSELPPPFAMQCPSCEARFHVRYREGQLNPDGTLSRVCVGCACRFRVRVEDSSIVDWSHGAISPGTIVARRAAYAVVACSVDGYPVGATFPGKGGNWHAYCSSHQAVMSVSRRQVREWMEEHDPAFLAARLLRENSGGVRVVSDG